MIRAVDIVYDLVCGKSNEIEGILSPEFTK
jgi:hypothetical protein